MTTEIERAKSTRSRGSGMLYLSSSMVNRKENAPRLPGIAANRYTFTGRNFPFNLKEIILI